MERFTKKVDGVWTALCNYGSSPYPVVTQEIIDRLAAYEDTGSTPEEVQQMRWIPVEERNQSQAIIQYLYTNLGMAEPTLLGQRGIAHFTDGYPRTGQKSMVSPTGCLYQKRQRRTIYDYPMPGLPLGFGARR